MTTPEHEKDLIIGDDENPILNSFQNYLKTDPRSVEQALTLYDAQPGLAFNALALHEQDPAAFMQALSFLSERPESLEILATVVEVFKQGLDTDFDYSKDLEVEVLADEEFKKLHEASHLAGDETDKKNVVDKLRRLWVRRAVGKIATRAA